MVFVQGCSHPGVRRLCLR